MKKILKNFVLKETLLERLIKYTSFLCCFKKGHSTLCKRGHFRDVYTLILPLLKNWRTKKSLSMESYFNAITFAKFSEICNALENYYPLKGSSSRIAKKNSPPSFLSPRFFFSKSKKSDS